MRMHILYFSCFSMLVCGKRVTYCIIRLGNRLGKYRHRALFKKHFWLRWERGGRGCSPHNPQISQYYTETLSHLEEFPHLSLNYPNQSTIFITHFQNTSLQTQFFKLKTYFVLYSVQVNITIYNSQIYTV